MNKFLLIALLSLISTYILAAEISFTIDHPGVEEVKGMDHVQVGEKILKALRKNDLKATLFVCGMRIDSPEGHKLISMWDNDDHLLGNHTYSHKNYNNPAMTTEAFIEDVRKNELLIKKYKNFLRVFRFPYLKEGETAQKLESFRKYLSNENYNHRHVTIDASDWYISGRLVEKLNKGEKINWEAFKSFYLNHIWDRAFYYNDLSKKLLKREIKHNVLLHHNPLNAYFLDDLIVMFKKKGWKVINTEEAFKDPAYAMKPKHVPGGESLIWALAKESGDYDTVLRYPAEDGEYLKDEMDKLGL